MDLRQGVEARETDPAARTVTTADGAMTRSDALVLATGSDDARPDVPGAHPAFVVRTLDDVSGIRAEIGRPRALHGRTPRGVVLGGGLLGLRPRAGCRSSAPRPPWCTPARGS